MNEEKKSPEWGQMGGGPVRQPKFFREQAENMAKLRDLLQGLLDQKQAEVATLQEKLLRLKHGGGQ